MEVNYTSQTCVLALYFNPHEGDFRDRITQAIATHIAAGGSGIRDYTVDKGNGAASLTMEKASLAAFFNFLGSAGLIEPTTHQAIEEYLRQVGEPGVATPPITSLERAGPSSSPQTAGNSLAPGCGPLSSFELDVENRRLILRSKRQNADRAESAVKGLLDIFRAHPDEAMRINAPLRIITRGESLDSASEVEFHIDILPILVKSLLPEMVAKQLLTQEDANRINGTFTFIPQLYSRNTCGKNSSGHWIYEIVDEDFPLRKIQFSPLISKLTIYMRTDNPDLCGRMLSALRKAKKGIMVMDTGPTQISVRLEDRLKPTEKDMQALIGAIANSPAEPDKIPGFLPPDMCADILSRMDLNPGRSPGGGSGGGGDQENKKYYTAASAQAVFGLSGQARKEGGKGKTGDGGLKR